MGGGVSSKMWELDIIIDRISLCDLLKRLIRQELIFRGSFSLIGSDFLWLTGTANMSGQQRTTCCLLATCLKKLFLDESAARLF